MDIINLILSLLKKKSTLVNENPVSIIVPVKELITLDDYLMGRDKKFPQEYTEEIKNNAIQLLKRVNEFLNEIGVEEVRVSSGWRPAAINSKVPNAAKRSAHMMGMAVDLADKDRKLKEKILENIHLLPKYGLWLENPDATPSWVHLDIKIRSARPKNIFNP